MERVELEYEDVIRIFSMAEQLKDHGGSLIFSKRLFLAKLYKTMDSHGQKHLRVSFPKVVEELKRCNFI